MNRFRPQRATSLGIIVQYRCTNHCDHCLYASHPGIEEHVEEEALDSIAESIANACPQATIHIGGGEPFLCLDRTIFLIGKLKERGLTLEYVETNGFWIRNATARTMLDKIREAGCPCVLLSISPFHNEFLSMEDNIRAYQMIVEVFGEEGIFPWHPAYYRFLRRVATDRPVPFKEYARHFSKDEIRFQLTSVIYLHPAGRAGVIFSSFLERHPHETYALKNCAAELSSPVHAHLDPYGDYLTGFCSGLRLGCGAGFDLERLYREGLALEQYPILEMLIRGTLGDLLGYAVGRGFTPDQGGYVSPCHLCGHLRTWLYQSIPTHMRPSELAPAFFYEEMDRLFSR
jgi:hypothetical protein